MIERYLEDFAVGQTFGSGRLRIDEQRIKTFAAEFDPQPFLLVEMEGLRIELRGKGLDPLLVDPQAPGAKRLPHGKILEVSLDHPGSFRFGKERIKRFLPLRFAYVCVRVRPV